MMSVKKELSYQEAQALAIKLANDAFGKKEFKNPYNGNIIPAVRIDYIAGKKEGDRWVFTMAGPAGPYATISFDAHGGDRKVDVGYSWQ